MGIPLTLFPGKSFSRPERLLYWSACFFIVSLFVPHIEVITNISIAVLCVTCLCFNSFKSKWMLLKRRAEIACMLLFFLLQILSAFLSLNRQTGFHLLILRLPLLLFPFCLGLVPVQLALRDKIFIFFTLAVSALAVVCLSFGVYRYFISGDSGVFYDDSLTMLVGRQSVYIGCAVTISLFMLISLWKSQEIRLPGRIVVFAAFILQLVFQWLLAGRTMLIFFYGTLILGLLSQILVRRNRRMAMPALFAVICVTVAATAIFPKTLNRFRELKYPSFHYSAMGMESHYNMKVSADQWNGANIRLAIWSSAAGLLKNKHNLLFGVPLGDKQDALIAEYGRRQFRFGVVTRRNTHNSYLDVLLNTGIPGLLIFLCGYLIIPIIKRLRKGDVGSLLIVSTLAVGMITETYIDRSLGCIMIGFFLSLVAASKNTSQASALSAR